MLNSEETESEQGIKYGQLTTTEMVSQGIILFVAGADTSAIAMSHLIYYLSVNKDCQQKLYEELREVKEFSYESLSELKYLNSVINETLRLAPPGNIIPRLSVKDFELSGRFARA